MQKQVPTSGNGEALVVWEEQALFRTSYLVTTTSECRKALWSLWRRRAVASPLKWTAMTVGARSMDSHTNRRRSHDPYRDNQWAHHPVIGIRNLPHQLEVTLDVLQ